MASPCVLNASPAVLQQMKTHYQAFLVPQPAAHTYFMAKKNGTTITAYQSGKVVFQGKNSASEAQRWAAQTQSSPPTQKKTTNDAELQQLRTQSVLGSDEVGNGSYFGPLVVCAAYVDKTMIPTLNKLGVKDSKQLTDERISQLAQTLKSLIPYQKLLVTPKKYNAMQPKYNAVHMKAVLHNQAIYLLLEKLKPEQPEAILIDQFTPAKNYFRYIQDEAHQVKTNVHFVTKGEQYHLAVAAASILSRAAFLESLAQASETIGFPLPSGAGKKADETAATILQLGGLTLLRQYAKLHFANTQKAQQLVAKQNDPPSS